MISVLKTNLMQKIANFYVNKQPNKDGSQGTQLQHHSKSKLNFYWSIKIPF